MMTSFQGWSKQWLLFARACLSDSESEDLLGFSSELCDSDCNILDSVSSGDSECNFSREVPPRKIFEVNLCSTGATQTFGQQFMNSKVIFQEFQ
jgi:hypothetical protein